MKFKSIISILCGILFFCSCSHKNSYNISESQLQDDEEIFVQEDIIKESEKTSYMYDEITNIEIVDFVRKWAESGVQLNGMYALAAIENLSDDMDYQNEKLYIDCESLIDNQTNLSFLLEQTKRLSAFETYLLMNYRFLSYLPDSFGETAHITIKATEAFVGQEVSFIRTTNDFYNNDSNWPENGKRCYTVFESELGGYVYVFFDWYPDTQGINTKIRKVAYCSALYSCEDLKTIAQKDNNGINKFIVLYPEFKSLENLKYSENSQFAVSVSILLQDGIFTGVASKAGEGTSFNVGTLLTEGNIIIYENGELNEANNIDFTILPQDYPPAS